MRYRQLIGLRPLASALGLALLLTAGRVRADGASASPTRLRFQLRSECTCASCGFALQDQLHKLRGVGRIDLSPRDRTVTLTLDESQTPLSRVAAVLAGTEIGKRSALIGELPTAPTAPDAAALSQLPGVKHAEVDRKKSRLLLELANGSSLTAAELTGTLARAGFAVSLDPGSSTASRHQ